MDGRNASRPIIQRARQNYTYHAFTAVRCDRAEQEVNRPIAVMTVRVVDQFTEAPGRQSEVVSGFPNIGMALIEVLSLAGDYDRHL